MNRCVEFNDKAKTCTRWWWHFIEGGFHRFFPVSTTQNALFMLFSLFSLFPGFNCFFNYSTCPYYSEPLPCIPVFSWRVQTQIKARPKISAKNHQLATYLPTKFSSTELLPALCPPTTAICGKSNCMWTPIDVNASCSLFTIGMSDSIPMLPDIFVSGCCLSEPVWNFYKFFFLLALSELKVCRFCFDAVITLSYSSLNCYAYFWSICVVVLFRFLFTALYHRAEKWVDYACVWEREEFAFNLFCVCVSTLPLSLSLSRCVSVCQQSFSSLSKAISLPWTHYDSFHSHLSAYNWKLTQKSINFHSIMKSNVKQMASVFFFDQIKSTK